MNYDSGFHCNEWIVPSVVRFVSRTGKTTDFTKIKGWRDKFSGSGSHTEGITFYQLFITKNMSFNIFKCNFKC